MSQTIQENPVQQQEIELADVVFMEDDNLEEEVTGPEETDRSAYDSGRNYNTERQMIQKEGLEVEVQEEEEEEESESEEDEEKIYPDPVEQKKVTMLAK